MKTLFIIFFLFAGLRGSEVNHEFHLSKSILNYDSKEQSIQITINIFIDDLELALKQEGHDSLRICTQKESDDAEQVLYDYILNHFDLKVDGNQVIPTFLGKEPSDDLAAVWCYLEIDEIPTVTNVSISNTILTQVFEDQKNITTFQVDKKRVEDFIFTSSKTEEIVRLRL